MYDLIIRGGTVIDGTGAPARPADIAISDGKIAAVGEIPATAESQRQIDASGHIVTPGWVDVHTHYDGQATWDPVLAPSSWHGVTTVVMGNCGVGFAPVRAGDEDFLIQLMEGVEDIPGSALAEGINWQWESFAEYLDALEKTPRTIDVAAQVPHGAVRAYVMGKRCNVQNEEPTPEEIAQMAQLVHEGVAAGALGFSSSRTWLHRDVNGVHVPGTFAGSNEMLALGLSMEGLQHGVFEMVSDHLGNDDEWDWVQAFAERTGRTVTLVATSAEAYADGKMYRIAEDARERGIDIRPQSAGRPTGVLHGLQSSFHIFVRHPAFQKIADLPLPELIEAMRDPGTREQLTSDRSLLMTGLVPDIDQLMAQVFPLGEKPNYEPDFEDSVAGIAQARDEDPVQVMYDLLLDNDGRELFYQPLGSYRSYNFDGFFKDILEHPNVLFGLSDGGAHCGVIADAGMPTFILTHWARDRVKGDHIPLEYLVRKLSSDTARAYGMTDRGELNAGQLADINVINFDDLQLHRPEAVFDLPQNGRRLVQKADGYRYIIKRGEVTFEDGEHTGALPGGLVRGGLSA